MGNFQGSKTSQFLQFDSQPWKFSPWKFRHATATHKIDNMITKTSDDV